MDAGRFGRPSTNDGDVRIEARNGSTLVGGVKVMVRIRKNANRLTPGERSNPRFGRPPKAASMAATRSS